MKAIALTLALLAGTVAASAQQTGTYQGVPVVVVPQQRDPFDQSQVFAKQQQQQQQERERAAEARAESEAQQRAQQAQRGTTTTYSRDPNTGQTKAVTKPNQW